MRKEYLVLTGRPNAGKSSIIARASYVNHVGYCLMCGYKNLSCPYCGSTHIQKRGARKTKLRIAVNYYCVDCGKWFTR